MQIREIAIGKKLVLYQKGHLQVFGVASKQSGYGWLGYRAACAFPPDLAADIWVFPPSDAERIAETVDIRLRSKNSLRLCLCAVDGTEIPAGWRKSIEEFFDGVILMVNHSSLSEKCPKYVGEFYPKPRTLCFLEENKLDIKWQPPLHWGEKRIVLGSVVTYHFRKGFDLLAAIAWKIYKLAPHIKFRLVADTITALLLRNSLPTTVEILQNLSEREILDFYLSLHAFFSTSMGEGGALPVAEAAVLSVPIITPDHTAFSHLPATKRISCTPQPAPIDAHLSGDIFVPDVSEFVETLLQIEKFLSPPSGGDIKFEDVAPIVNHLALL